MEITKDTRLAKILSEYGDRAGDVEVRAGDRTGRFTLRALAERDWTIEEAAREHRMPVVEFLIGVKRAVGQDVTEV